MSPNYADGLYNILVRLVKTNLPYASFWQETKY